MLFTPPHHIALAQQEPEPTAETELWSATLTAGELRFGSILILKGYETSHTLGGVEPDSFTHDEREFTVGGLYNSAVDERTFLVVGNMGEGDFILRVGDMDLFFDQTDYRQIYGAYQINHPGEAWPEGNTLRVWLAQIARPDAPTVAASIDDMALDPGDRPIVDLSTHLSGVVDSYSVESSDPNAVRAWTSGTEMKLLAARPGTATITVNAENRGGSAQTRFDVSVADDGAYWHGVMTVGRLPRPGLRSGTDLYGFGLASSPFHRDASGGGGDMGALSPSSFTHNGNVVHVAHLSLSNGVFYLQFSRTADGSNAVWQGEGSYVLRLGDAEIPFEDSFGSHRRAQFEGQFIPGINLFGFEIVGPSYEIRNFNGPKGHIAEAHSSGEPLWVSLTRAAPKTKGAIPALEVVASKSETVDVSGYFTDHVWRYEAESSDTDIATVSVEGSVVTVRGVSVGQATITARAMTGGGSAEQTFTATVTVNTPPTLEFAPTQAKVAVSGSVVSMGVVASDVETPNELTFAWTQVWDGPRVTLNGSDKSRAWFTAPDLTSETPLGFTVTVTDGGGLSASRFIVILVGPADSRVSDFAFSPTTARPGETAVSDTITVDGITEDVKLAVAAVSGGSEFTWFVNGMEKAASVGYGDSFRIEARAGDVPGDVTTIRVTMGEGENAVSADWVLTSNAPPSVSVASTQALTAASGREVRLEGDVSDPDGSPGGLSYAWTQTGGPDSVTISGADALVASFVAPEVSAGTDYTFLLTATDALGASDEAEVTVRVNPRAPSAKGGIFPLPTIPGYTHTGRFDLNFEGVGVKYSAQSSKPAVASVTANGGEYTIEPLSGGRTTITLTATNDGGSATQRFDVYVYTISQMSGDSGPPPVRKDFANQAPVFPMGDSVSISLARNAGAGVNVGAPLSANDPDGDGLTYLLLGADADSFDLNPATGQLTTKAGVSYDFGTQTSYSLTVVAADTRGDAGYIQATVEAADCLTDLGEPASREAFSGAWDVSGCRAHHRTDSAARYFRFTLSEETNVSLSLDSGVGELFLSNGDPQNGWGTPPKGTMEHRLKARLDNGKLLNEGDGRLSLLLPAGDYTAEVVNTSGGGTFTLTIATGR